MIIITGELLLLLIAANGSPVVVAKLLGSHLNWPVDGGLQLPDGQPLFGASKTWRGLVSASLACSMLSWLLGHGWLFGLAFGALAMVGDLCSSFVKRRLKIQSSHRATGIDQVPEALLPLWGGSLIWDYGYGVVLLGTLTFMLIEMLGSPLLFYLGIRKRPY